MSNASPQEDASAWIVLVNGAGEHCLWPASAPVPAGWRETGPEGPADRCAAWVDRHWAAMRPAGLKD